MSSGGVDRNSSGPLDNEFIIRIFQDFAELEALCRRYRIRRLSLFGSALKGINRPDSDADPLVEFEPDARPSLLTMAEIEIELSPLLGGRKVDLRTAGDLSWYFREAVIMLDATQNYRVPLTAGRLCDWHAALFPTGRSGRAGP